MKIKGNLIDIHNRIIYPAEIELSGEKIKTIKRIKERQVKYLLPGLIDAHVHIESSMVTPAYFAYAAVSHGTVGAVSDPHEIANVLGTEGVQFMLDNTENIPFYFWFGAPSCVPTTDFETAGGRLDAGDIESLLGNKKLKYLSEMMNFPGVINGQKGVWEKIRVAKKLEKPIDGHAPRLSGKMLEDYVAAGISTDHESSTIEEAKEKLNLGMKILIREGSAARNLDALKDLFNTDPKMIMLCSDDIHPEMIREKHINKIVAKLVREGYDLYDVIRSCTINPKEHYKLEAGMLIEGDPADFIIVDDPAGMNVSETWIKGKKVFDGTVKFKIKESNKVNRFNASVVGEQELKVHRNGNKIRVIKASDGELLTGCEIYNVIGTGFIEPDITRDILKIVVKDRYKDNPPSIGFINGFGLKKGAFASSVSHDSHNIICIGTNDRSIVECINAIIRMKGGLAVSSDGKLDSLQLNIAGIMSDEPVNNVAEAYMRLSEKVKENGCILTTPFMTLSFMALLVIPELKISDLGLFDGRLFNFTTLFAE